MDSKGKHLAIFEGRQIRRHWDDQLEKWYFSVVDVVQVLTAQPDFQTARKYWNKLKERLGIEGNQSVTKCHQLKLQASDGKYYLTDVADTEVVLRLIQSIPSPNAEPFKLWLAQVGKERIDEIRDPELAVNRAKAIYERKGYPRDWIDKRLRGINIRNTLTDEWKSRGLKEGKEFAILTDEIYKGACF
ncbi:MAG: Bro-N domain-containing protein [Candidatus Taylorbacteria bacterium]